MKSLLISMLIFFSFNAYGRKMTFYPIDIKTVEAGIEFDMSGSPSNGTLLNNISSELNSAISEIRQITCEIREHVGAGYCQSKPIKPENPGPRDPYKYIRPYKYLIRKENTNFSALTSLLVSSYTAGSEVTVTYEVDYNEFVAVVKQIAIK